MTSLVGSTSWGTTHAWPVGTRVGDVAVLVRVERSVGDRLADRQALQTWRLVKTLSNNRSSRAYVYTRTVQDLSTPPMAAAPFTCLLLVVRDTTGPGAVNVGTFQVQARAGGGVLVVSETQSATAADLPAFGWRTPSGLVRYTDRITVGFAGVTSTGLAGPGGTQRPRASLQIALEFLPPASPLPPEVLSPETGAEVSNAAPVGFGWRHRPAREDGWQRAYRLRVADEDGVLRYWSAGAGQLVEAVTSNSGSVPSAAVPAAQLEVGTPWSWAVQTQEDVDGRWSDWSAEGEFRTVAPPTVQVSAPAGTVTGDLSPDVVWAAGLSGRRVQIAFQVQVVALGQVVYDSQIQPGPSQRWTLPVLDWVNGLQVQVRVRIQQTGGAWSSWTARDFSVVWTPPAVPQVSAVAGRDGVEVVAQAGAGLVEQVLRKNLVPNPRPVSTAAWRFPANDAVGYVAEDGALFIRRTTGVPYVDPVTDFAASHGLAVGRWIAIGAEARPMDAASAGAMRVRFGVYGGAAAAGNVGPVRTVPQGSYTRLTHAAQITTLPASGYVRAFVWPDAGNEFRMRRMVVAVADTEAEARAAVQNPLDGDTPDIDGKRYRWTGTPSASPSEEYQLVPGQVGEWDGITQLTVERIDPNGATWSTVVPYTPTGELAFTDVFAPHGQPTAYRARAATVLDGMPLASEYGRSDPVTPVHRRAYLAAAASPATTWLQVLISEDAARTLTEDAAVSYGLDDSYGRVSYSRQRGWSGQVTVTAVNQADRDALLGLLAAQERLLLQLPPDRDQAATDTLPVLTVARSGPVQVARRAQADISPRDVTVQFVEQPAVPVTGDTDAPTTHLIEGIPS